MKKHTISIIFLFIVTFFCVSGCGSNSNDDKSFAGTWYSVEDGTMYNFSDGQITVSGVSVGQYEEAVNYIVVSLQEDNSNTKMYITTAYDATVLSNSPKGDGYVYFCRGIDNAERIMHERENVLQVFYNEHSDGFMSKVTGIWETLDIDATYKSIDINMHLHHADFYHSDSSPKKGTYVPDNFEKENDGTVKHRLIMENRGYESPTVYYYMDGHASYVLEIYVDKSNGGDGELVMDFHTATNTVRYTKAKN